MWERTKEKRELRIYKTKKTKKKKKNSNSRHTSIVYAPFFSFSFILIRIKTRQYYSIGISSSSSLLTWSVKTTDKNTVGGERANLKMTFDPNRPFRLPENYIPSRYYFTDRPRGMCHRIPSSSAVWLLFFFLSLSFFVDHWTSWMIDCQFSRWFRTSEILTIEQ